MACRVRPVCRQPAKYRERLGAGKNPRGARAEPSERKLQRRP